PEQNMIIVKQKMAAGRGDIDRTGFHGRTAFGRQHAQGRRLSEYLRQVASDADMENDEDGGGEIDRQATHKRPQGPETSRRAAHDDDVVSAARKMATRDWACRLVVHARSKAAVAVAGIEC